MSQRPQRGSASVRYVLFRELQQSEGSEDEASAATNSNRDEDKMGEDGTDRKRQRRLREDVCDEESYADSADEDEVSEGEDEDSIDAGSPRESVPDHGKLACCINAKTGHITWILHAGASRANVNKQNEEAIASVGGLSAEQQLALLTVCRCMRSKTPKSR